MTQLDETISAAQAGHITDHQQIAIKENAWFNVKADFGAVGNGTADDRAAIQAAYDALPSTVSGTTAVGGILFFPPGVYKVGTPGLDFYTDLKPAWILGAQGTSTNLSANRVAVKLITSAGNYPLMQIGAESGSAQWYGVKVSNIMLRDATAANTSAGIWLGTSNDCLFENVTFANWTAGTGLLQQGSSFQPQYTTLIRCIFSDCKFGIKQAPQSGGSGTDYHSSDTELYGCYLFGATSGTDVPPGSVGITTYSTLRMFGGSIQEYETAAVVADSTGTSGQNKFIGTAFENTLAGGLIGIDIQDGDNTIISDTDFSGTYGTTRVKIASGVVGTVISNWPVTSATNRITDAGTDTWRTGPLVSVQARRRTTAQLTGAFAVECGSGTMMYNTSTSKPAFSDGTVFRYADGTAV